MPTKKGAPRYGVTRARSAGDRPRTVNVRWNLVDRKTLTTAATFASRTLARKCARLLNG